MKYLTKANRTLVMKPTLDKRKSFFTVSSNGEGNNIGKKLNRNTSPLVIKLISMYTSIIEIKQKRIANKPLLVKSNVSNKLNQQGQGNSINKRGEAAQPAIQSR
jgi:hypothetical protein